ncbi:MAG: segregation/condensation protein A [Gammaproteobacteria bacterium]|nr:segregation/condensation protein A [Gammaproteobacteria bacterium]
MINQLELPFALVLGQPYTELPKDLYIPPQALEVILEAFEGPLDLLLYLIKRQNLDILDIPINEITDQYVQYISMMDAMQFELAGEYLVMAAMLAEIKSRMLLPRSSDAAAEEDDPRAELIRRLQEYERYKEAAEDLNALPREERDFQTLTIAVPRHPAQRARAEVTLSELLLVMRELLGRVQMFAHHQIQREPLSVRERMARLLEQISSDSFHDFTTLFTLEEGRRGVVVTFIAILELIKQSLLELVQAEPNGPIHVRLLMVSTVTAAGAMDE